MKNRISVAAAFVCALALLPASRARAGATVKSSKSNSSDRAAAGSTTGTQPVRTPTVKSSKSNSSDRAVSNGTKDPTPAEAKFHGNGLNQTREAAASASGIVTNVDAAAKTISIRQANGSIITMDSSRLAKGIAKVGLRVNVDYTSVGSKLSAQSIAVERPGSARRQGRLEREEGLGPQAFSTLVPEILSARPRPSRLKAAVRNSSPAVAT